MKRNLKLVFYKREDMYSPCELADLLKCNVSKIHRWIRDESNNLPPFCKDKISKYFEVVTIENWLKKLDKYCITL